MTETIEFGSMPAADAARDEFADHLCTDDDRRMKTVRFSSETPDSVLEEIQRDADASRGGDQSGPGQAELTDREKRDIDFSEINPLKARRAKAIFLDEGVTDWLSYFSEDLQTAAEWREKAQQAKRDQQGQRLDAEERTEEELQARAGRATRRADQEECDHAAGHCANGDPDACEFIREECGIDPDRVMAREDPDPPEMPADTEDGEITGPALGALNRAWGGIHGAVSEAQDHLDALAEEWENAQQAARAVNEIRADHGQDELHIEVIEDLQAELTDFLRKVRADCSECHAYHGDHDHDLTDGPREDVRDALDGMADTPVGTAAEDSDGDAPEFAPEQQQTLAGNVDAEETAQDEQVTLTGDTAGGMNQALPREWEMVESGDVMRWLAGPLEVEAKPSDQTVWLWGPEDLKFTVAQNLPADQVADAGREFVDRIKPPDVDFADPDAEMAQAAAEAKKSVANQSGGLSQFTDD